MQRYGTDGSPRISFKLGIRFWWKLGWTQQKMSAKLTVQVSFLHLDSRTSTGAHWFSCRVANRSHWSLIFNPLPRTSPGCNGQLGLSSRDHPVVVITGVLSPRHCPSSIATTSCLPFPPPLHVLWQPSEVSLWLWRWHGAVEFAYESPASDFHWVDGCNPASLVALPLAHELLQPICCWYRFLLRERLSRVWQSSRINPNPAVLHNLSNMAYEDINQTLLSTTLLTKNLLVQGPNLENKVCSSGENKGGHVYTTIQRGSEPSQNLFLYTCHIIIYVLCVKI